jgi:FemAB-related protein (PEP-CTERM system-associated)
VNGNSIQVRQIDPTQVGLWAQYVLAQPSATVFHLPAWSEAVADAYGHRPFHLGAWSGDRLVGVLPLFCVRSIFVGRVFVSVPYATYGGIAADTPDASLALLEAAQALCRESGAQYLELRHRDPSGLDLPEVGQYDTFRKELPARPEEVLEGLPRKTRAAAKKGLEQLGEDSAAFGPEWLDTIYDLYAYTLRRLGSPNYRRQLFRQLQKGFGENCVCLVVRDKGRPVAGVLSLVFRDEIVPYFSGSLPEGMAKNANNVMYLRLMEYAVRRKLRWFDFNRSRRDNHGPHAFKRYHGFEPAPLHYQLYLCRARQAPNLTPSNRKFAMASKLWRKLPLWATRPAGAVVTRWIP